MTRTIRLFLLSLATVAIAAACTAQAAAPSVASLEDPAATSDPNASASPSAPTDPQDAFLAFAKCMRDHGIDMPDPEVSDEGGGKFSVGFSGGGPGAGGADAEKFKEANEACQPLLENAIGEDSRPELTPEQEQAMLDFARCMRDHGIDMPDPGENGMVFNVGGPGKDFDRETFEAAQEACQDLLPGRLGGEDGPSLQVGPGGGANGESGPAVKSDEESN